MTIEAAELLKEINESARHWEKLVFENVKTFFHRTDEDEFYRRTILRSRAELARKLR
jgi:hypothetical protein